MSDDHSNNKFSPLHDVQLQPLRHFADSSSSSTTTTNNKGGDGNGNVNGNGNGSSDLHAIHITSVSPHGNMNATMVADDNDDGNNGMGGSMISRNRRSSHDGIDHSPIPKQWPSVLRDGWDVYLRRSCREVLLTSKMNWFLCLIPFAFISKYADWSPSITFVFSLLALCPLAERISFVTEELAKYTNETIGGLLNASMGNITELIVSLVALQNGLLRIVQVSLLGSILSNLLLVLGCAFLAGGIKNPPHQKFNQLAASTNSALLLLAVGCLLFPAVLDATRNDNVRLDLSKFRTLNGTATLDDLRVDTSSSVLGLSRFIGFIMLIMYGLFILFQLKTHASLFADREEEEEEEAPILGFWGAFAWCIVITIFIAFLSEFIVDSIELAAKSLGIPVLFIGAILLPIVGNAAEHAAAIIFAMKNKMDISLGIAAGSATQIALFVIPLTVIVGWMMDQPMGLDFQMFETWTLFITIMITVVILQSGKSDYLKGALLLAAYLAVSASFWVHPSDDELDK